MLIVALVLAVVGLVSLVTAVVTSNELVAWVCIAASVLGVILLVVDAIRERQSRKQNVEAEDGGADDGEVADYPDDDAVEPEALDEPSVETETETAVTVTEDVESEPVTDSGADRPDR